MKDTNSAANTLAATFEKIKDNIDVSTVIGDPVYTESGLTILPISKVTYGLTTGGSEDSSGGAGMTITPVAFLLIKDGQVTVKHITNSENKAEKMVNLGTDVFDKMSGLLNK
ncbi:MAG: sporulation protein YtfJ [Clostridia bacterium]|nr:sporulation protein YtfJ [Clostridia bacterium]